MRLARRYVISGRVQGVGFRFFVENAAAVEGIAGWARNLTDGGVEVVAEGERDSLLRFEAKLRLGPPRARVDHVDVEERAAAGRHSGFSIRG
jgi:acylphosphatase